MDRRSLFAIATVAVFVGIAFLLVGGFSANEQAIPAGGTPRTEQEVQDSKKTTEPVKPVSGSGAVTTPASPTPDVVEPAPSTTHPWSLKPFLMKHRPELMHPANSDSIAIGANGPDNQVDLAGWKVRSTMSGKTFTVPTVLNPTETGSHAPIRIGNPEIIVFVHTVGSAGQNYRTENEFHLYFAEPAIAWKDHDTIQLVSPKGEVVDTYSY